MCLGISECRESKVLGSVFTQTCRHSLRGFGQRVMGTDLIREQFLREGCDGVKKLGWNWIS